MLVMLKFDVVLHQIVIGKEFDIAHVSMFFVFGNRNVESDLKRYDIDVVVLPRCSQLITTGLELANRRYLYSGKTFCYEPFPGIPNQSTQSPFRSEGSAGADLAPDNPDRLDSISSNRR